MLKIICRLFLGLVVCAGSACVTPTHASSAIDDIGPLPNVVITQIQASGELGAKDEYVVLHNNSGVEVDITYWCFHNKSRIEFACFYPLDGNITEYYLIPPYGDAVIASSNHVQASGRPASDFTLVYEVTNQSSGSIISSSDAISILGEGGMYIDLKHWDNAIPSGKILSRVLLMSGPDIYADTNSDADWVTVNRILPPKSSVKVVLPVDMFPPDEYDPDTEPGSSTNPDDETTNQETDMLPPIITELLANPAGSDTGKEFIELYNPNEHESISLNAFTLKIGIGTIKTYSFPSDISIPPKSYRAFSNQEMGYTLANTAGKVQLVMGSQNIGSAIEYANAKDDDSWALVGNEWVYTKPATPGSANSTLKSSAKNVSKDSSPKPCAMNQFRNPETGKCKLIATSTAPAPCKENQVRNPATNRCRNIAVTASPAPCKEGQERNPETNRCRTIVKMTNVGHGVDVNTKTDTAMSWYYWAAIGAIILLILAYAVWEWREELKNIWQRTREKFAKQPD